MSIRPSSRLTQCEEPPLRQHERRGVTLAEVLQVADWSSDSTFRRFYYRPEGRAVYAHKVLSPSGVA